MERDKYNDEIRDILSNSVVGMSKNPSKSSFVPQLSENGFDVNPNSDMGKKPYKTVSYDVFCSSDQILPIVGDAIKKKPQVIWLQERIYNSEAEKSDIILFNRCILAEHRRLF